MKQTNKFKKFGKTNLPEKQITCSCGAKAKLKSSKNYPHGKKSKAVKFQYYKCEECGEKKLVKEVKEKRRY